MPPFVASRAQTVATATELGHVAVALRREGRWTSAPAIEEGIAAPVLTSALYSRFSSPGLDDFADRVLSAMRKQFGGHAEKGARLEGRLVGGSLGAMNAVGDFEREKRVVARAAGHVV